MPGEDWDSPGQGRPISNLEVNTVTNKLDPSSLLSSRCPRAQMGYRYVPTLRLTRGDLRKALPSGLSPSTVGALLVRCSVVCHLPQVGGGGALR